LELYPLSDAEKVRMLRKLALFWDGQWFLRAADMFGLDEAIGLNAAVRTSFGRIEMRTMLKALGKKEAHGLADAVRMIATHSDLLLGPGIRADYELSERRAQVVVRRCAAYEGAKRANLPRQDQACISCEALWDVWFDVLLPSTEIRVQHLQRQGFGDGVCKIVAEEIP